MADGYSKRLLRKETSFIITEMLTNSQLPANTVKNPEAFEKDNEPTEDCVEDWNFLWTPGCVVHRVLTDLNNRCMAR